MHNRRVERPRGLNSFEEQFLSFRHFLLFCLKKKTEDKFDYQSTAKNPMRGCLKALDVSSKLCLNPIASEGLPTGEKMMQLLFNIHLCNNHPTV